MQKKKPEPIPYYVHGDLVQKYPNLYHCTSCDDAAPREHFFDSKHIHSRADTYARSLALWDRVNKKYPSKYSRLGKAENILEGLVADDKKAIKTKRSPFVRWIFRQRDSKDPKSGLRHPIADLAYGISQDSTFPIHLNSKKKNKEYLICKSASSKVLSIFDEAWKEFSSKPRHSRENISLSLRHSVLKRDGFQCQDCGGKAIEGVCLEVDHKIPVAKGGSNSPDNLRTLCFECNRGKRDKDL